MSTRRWPCCIPPTENVRRIILSVRIWSIYTTLKVYTTTVSVSPAASAFMYASTRSQRAETAEGGLVLPPYYRESLHHVGRVVSGETVEDEVKRVEPGPQMAALLFVPDERRPIVTHDPWRKGAMSCAV